MSCAAASFLTPSSQVLKSPPQGADAAAAGTTAEPSQSNTNASCRTVIGRMPFGSLLPTHESTHWVANMMMGLSWTFQVLAEPKLAQ
jgi:hypothetical protein